MYIPTIIIFCAHWYKAAGLEIIKSCKVTAND